MSTSDPLQPTGRPLEAPSPEQREEIIEVLQNVCPLEVDLLGPTVVEHIVAGREFKPVTGGRHINLVDTASLVSCVAVVIQLVLSVWNPFAPHKDVDSAAEPAEREERARRVVESQASVNPQLQEILAKQSQVLEQVILAVRQLRGSAAKG
jgi:hypothetical protein